MPITITQLQSELKSNLTDFFNGFYLGEGFSKHFLVVLVLFKPFFLDGQTYILHTTHDINKATFTVMYFYLNTLMQI